MSRPTRRPRAATGTAAPWTVAGATVLTTVLTTVLASALTGVLTGCGTEARNPSAAAAAVTTGATPAAVTTGTTPGTAGPAGTTTVTAAAARAGSQLVAGFPADLVPVPPGTQVTSSAVTPASGGLQMSLTGTTSLSITAVLAFYRDALTRAGFTTTKGDVLPTGATGAAYSRNGDEELLVVAVVDDGNRRSFSVGGTVRV